MYVYVSMYVCMYIYIFFFLLKLHFCLLVTVFAVFVSFFLYHISYCINATDHFVSLKLLSDLRHQDWSYRNIINPVETYSEKQMDYFSTLPAQRFDLLKTWGYLPKDDDQPDPTSDTQTQVNGHG